MARTQFRPPCIEIEVHPAPNLFAVEQVRGRCLSKASTPNSESPHQDKCGQLAPASALRARLGVEKKEAHQEAPRETPAGDSEGDNPGKARHIAASKTQAPAQRDQEHGRERVGRGEPYDDAGAVFSSEDEVLLSRGTVSSEDALLSRGTVLSDVSCETELSAKETPRAFVENGWSQVSEQPRKVDTVNASSRTVLALAGINEGLGDDDWEEWEMQAFREQQEQITRDCRMLAEQELQRQKMEQYRDEQMAMVRFLQAEQDRKAQASKRATHSEGSEDAAPSVAASQPPEDDEVVVIRDIFTHGMRVWIHSLRAHADLNGLSGVVVSRLSGRVNVELGDGRQIALRPHNLRVDIPCPRDSPANTDASRRPTSAPPKPSCPDAAKRNGGKLFGSKKLHKLFSPKFSSNKVSAIPFLEAESEEKGRARSSRTQQRSAWDK